MNYYLSVGQFNQDSDAFDGPGSDPDGVHRLDSASIYMDLAQLTTDPPYAFIGAGCEVVVPGLWLGSTIAEASFVRVYPNPASDLVQIELPEMLNVMVMELRSVDDRLIRPVAVQPGQRRLTISLEGMAPGVYHLRTGSPSGSRTSLIIKVL